MTKYKMINMSDRVFGFPEFHIMGRDRFGWKKIACVYEYKLARKIVRLLKENANAV